MMESSVAPEIFVSYAGPDRSAAVALRGALHACGRTVFVDCIDLAPGDPWDVTITGRLRDAALIVVLISGAWRHHDAWYAHDEVARAVSLARDPTRRVRVVPAIIGAVVPVDMPSGLARLVPLLDAGQDWSVTARRLDDILAGRGEGVLPGDRLGIGPQISISRLPTAGPSFVGRRDELDALDAAWADARTNVQTIVGIGGQGKSALVSRWLDRMAADDFRGAVRVFGWSFYSQGAAEGRQASAALFVHQLLLWLGDDRPHEGDGWQKGMRLAQFLREQRTLLVLDGLEPLQQPPGPSVGQLKDPALLALLKELRARMHGLCIVTSRQPVVDLSGSTLVDELRLPPLPAEDGLRLLRTRGVLGPDRDLECASDELRGHALALSLLGRYLVTYEEADIRRRDRIESLLDAESGGDHARRVVDAYDRHLRPSQRQLLRVLGLFDRGAEPAALRAVVREPPLAGLTDALPPVGTRPWQAAVAHLREAGLIERGGETLDAHPLVRAWGDARLRDDLPVAFSKAHDRLYRHFTAMALPFPDDLIGMEPLYRAVAHGCAAGHHRAVLRWVYNRRIKRGTAHYSSTTLGASVADLSAVAHFFEVPFARPHSAFRGRTRCWLLHEAGAALKAVGRTGEAVAPMSAALNEAIAISSWQQATTSASQLVEILCVLGHLKHMPSADGRLDLDAVSVARRGVDLADHLSDSRQHSGLRALLAAALYLRGRIRSARALFVEAEIILSRTRGIFPRLHSLPGFHYRMLLLNDAPEDVLSRARRTLPMSHEVGMVHDVAMDHHAIGVASMCLAENAEDLDQAVRHLDEALLTFRRAGRRDCVPWTLIARATLRRRQTQWADARRDLDDAQAIAVRGDMRLHLVDAQIERARLALAQDDAQSAFSAWSAACEGVRSTAYHLRDTDVVELAAQLGLDPPAWAGRADDEVELPGDPPRRWSVQMKVAVLAVGGAASWWLLR